VSGLHANAERFRVAANNIVNAHSEGYQAGNVRSVSQTDAANQVGGVRNVITEGGSVDMAGDIVETIFARIGYTVNAKVIRSAEEMLGQLLDIRA
jgi:flagellar basal-body rod protein FlgC